LGEAPAGGTVLAFGPPELPIALLHVTGDHVLAAFADLATARAVESALRSEHAASGADPNLEPFEYELVEASTGRPPPRHHDPF
jgi:hypothetical protein